MLELVQKQVSMAQINASDARAGAKGSLDGPINAKDAGAGAKASFDGPNQC